MSSRKTMKDLVHAIKLIHRMRHGTEPISSKEVVEGVQRMIDDGVIDLFARSVSMAELLVQRGECRPPGQPKSGIIIASSLEGVQRP